MSLHYKTTYCTDKKDHNRMYTAREKSKFTFSPLFTSSLESFRAIRARGWPQYQWQEQVEQDLLYWYKKYFNSICSFEFISEDWNLTTVFIAAYKILSTARCEQIGPYRCGFWCDKSLNDQIFTARKSDNLIVDFKETMLPCHVYYDLHHSWQP